MSASMEAGPRDSVRQFYNVWDDPNHPRHLTYNKAVSPKLWSCRCVHPELVDAGQGRPPYDHNDHWKLALNESLCPRFAARYELYARLGKGGFGSVWAVRTRLGPDDDERPAHFAVKFQEAPLDDDEQYLRGFNTSAGSLPNMCVPFDVPIEGIVHALVDRRRPAREEFPQLEEVYWHMNTLIIVMQLVAVQATDRMNEVPPIPRRRGDAYVWENLPRIKSCTGYHKICEVAQHGPLHEADAARMMNSLLQATRLLFDAGCTHHDLAPRNYLVRADYKTVLIDFGMAVLHAAEGDFFKREAPEPRADSNAPPEDVIEELWGPESNTRVDTRRQDIWRIINALYTLLHGHRPWLVGAAIPLPRGDRLTDAQRQRQVVEPLGLGQGLSQDAADMLQTSLRPYPHERPTIEELATFPWFSGWQEDAGRAFRNNKIGRLLLADEPSD